MRNKTKKLVWAELRCHFTAQERGKAKWQHFQKCRRLPLPHISGTEHLRLRRHLRETLLRLGRWESLECAIVELQRNRTGSETKPRAMGGAKRGCPRAAGYFPSGDLVIVPIDECPVLSPPSPARRCRAASGNGALSENCQGYPPGNRSPFAPLVGRKIALNVALRNPACGGGWHLLPEALPQIEVC